MTATAQREQRHRSSLSESLGQLAYAGVFAVVVPGLLWLWAARTSSVVGLPAIHSTRAGAALVVAGAILAAVAMLALRIHGGGLPMNAYPPPKFVDRGVYAWVPHPIYVGFCAIVLGLAIFTGSRGGLWIAFPGAILGCAALVLGYERHDLLRRFGVAHPRTWLRLPDADGARPSWADRLRVHLLALGPWLVLYELFAWTGPAPDAIDGTLPFERSWPVLQWTEIFYASSYPGVVLASFVAPTRAELRRFATRVLLAMAAVFPLFLALPFVAPTRPFVPTSALGHLLAFERDHDTTACALPSFHVVMTMIAAATLASSWPRRAKIVWSWAAAVIVSCVTTSMHTILDVVGGVLVGFSVLRARALWEFARRAAERIAGSWREWELGPVRVINHGFYGGLAAGVGTLIAAEVAGPGSTPVVLVMFLSLVVCSALWAQIVEGSTQLLRPYGYYGGVIGAALGTLAAPLFGKSIWLMLAAVALAGPWIQALGRLRCLVQGCCHGAPAPEGIGIRITHPRSRVVRLAKLGGVPVHPTQLYSILWNVVIAVLLIRLWSVHAPLPLIGGLYYVLVGAGRFVEESYRGEPQTASWGGLHLYQWLAIAQAAIGVFTTMVTDAPRAPDFELTWPPVWAALFAFVVAAAALGMDFPRSNKRFSRLV